MDTLENSFQGEDNLLYGVLFPYQDLYTPKQPCLKKELLLRVLFMKKTKQNINLTVTEIQTNICRLYFERLINYITSLVQKLKHLLRANKVWHSNNEKEAFTLVKIILLCSNLFKYFC